MGAVDPPTSSLLPLSREEIEEVASEVRGLHQELINQGGRPTRDVREQPNTEVTFHEGVASWLDERTGNQIRCREYDFSRRYWHLEKFKHQQDLLEWTTFRKEQREPTSEHAQVLHDVLSSQKEALQTLGCAQPLLDVLTRLTDWRAFRIFCQGRKEDLQTLRLDDQGKLSTLYKALAVEKDVELRKEIERAVHNRQDMVQFWHHFAEETQRYIEWIDDEMVCLAKESITRLASTPDLLDEMEGYFRHEVELLQLELRNLSGSSFWDVHLPPNNATISEEVLDWYNKTVILSQHLARWRRAERFMAKQPCNAIGNPTTSAQQKGELWKRVITEHEEELDHHMDLIHCWNQCVRHWCRMFDCAHVKDSDGELPIITTEKASKKIEEYTKLEFAAIDDTPVVRKSLCAAEYAHACYMVLEEPFCQPVPVQGKHPWGVLQGPKHDDATSECQVLSVIEKLDGYCRVSLGSLWTPSNTPPSLIGRKRKAEDPIPAVRFKKRVCAQSPSNEISAASEFTGARTVLRAKKHPSRSRNARSRMPRAENRCRSIYGGDRMQLNIQNEEPEAEIMLEKLNNQEELPVVEIVLEDLSEDERVCTPKQLDRVEEASVAAPSEPEIEPEDVLMADATIINTFENPVTNHVLEVSEMAEHHKPIVAEPPSRRSARLQGKTAQNRLNLHQTQCAAKIVKKSKVAAPNGAYEVNKDCLHKAKRGKHKGVTERVNMDARSVRRRRRSEE